MAKQKRLNKNLVAFLTIMGVVLIVAVAALVTRLGTHRDPTVLAAGALEREQAGDLGKAADLYQTHDVDWQKDPTATSFDRTEPVVWKCLGHEADPAHAITAKGRLIGGTLDVIGMLPGTSYGDLEGFVAAYAPEGLLFYLDNCDFNPAQYCRMLHHLRLAGWFRHATALLIGRTAAQDLREFTPRDALRDALGDLTIPVIYDMDIGHLPPQLMLVNGALATLSFSEVQRSLAQQLV